MPVLTPQLGRRKMIVGIAAVAMIGFGAGSFTALQARQRVVKLQPGEKLPTPDQTEGPFYPKDWTGDVDADLVKVQGEAAQAQGTVTHVMGRVLDKHGNPLSGTRVEIWQCDANGVYRHPYDETATRRHDAGFQSRGRIMSGADGSYAFRTIRPVAYSGRTPHIHFHLETAAGAALTTQMYVAGEPLNVGDGVLNGIADPRQRDAVTVRLDPASGLEPGALAGTFDIVVWG